MAFTLNKICRSCNLKDRCDEDALMRSYVTSADRFGCPKYKSILDMDEINNGYVEMAEDSEDQERRRRQREKREQEEMEQERKQQEERAEFLEKSTEFINAMTTEQLFAYDKIRDFEKSCGPIEPKAGMDYKSFKEAYEAWSLRRTAFALQPFKSDLAKRYLQFLSKYPNTQKEKEKAKFHDELMNKRLLSALDDVLKTYREYGITGEGAQDEEIHQYALKCQKELDEKIVREKEEERKRKEEEERQKEEQKKEQQRKAEEKAERKRIEDERKRIENEKRKEEDKKKSQIFWIAWAAAAVILFIIAEEWWAYVLVGLGLVAAVAVKLVIWIFK